MLPSFAVFISYVSLFIFIVIVLFGMPYPSSSVSVM